MKRFLLPSLILVIGGLANAQTQQSAVLQDETHLRNAVSAYQDGLINNDQKLFLSSLGSKLIMFSGNFSNDQTKWQAHLFLSGEDIQKWALNFIKNVGPHKNSFEFLPFHIRNNAAVVVTRETGNNKFRQWKDETVTWFLGKENGNWKIVGFFIKDLKNPE